MQEIIKEIIKEIDAVTEENRKYKRDINEKLCEIRNKLGKVKCEDPDTKHVMSAKEAWDLAAGICLARPTTLMEIFDMSDPANIFVYIDPEAARCLWDAYFHKNKKDEEEIKPGDRVDVTVTTQNDLTYHDCIFVAEDDGFYYAVKNDSRVVSAFIKEIVRVRKCGKE